MCIKLEINQGYTMMHSQPLIKTYLLSPVFYTSFKQLQQFYHHH